MRKRDHFIIMIALCLMLVMAILALIFIIATRSGDEETPSAGSNTIETPTPDMGENRSEKEPPEEALPENKLEDGGGIEDLALRSMISEMSLHEKVCQMFIVLPDALTNVGNTTLAGEKLKKGLEQYPVGGLVFLSGNIDSEQQIKLFIDNASSYSKIGLFLTCDEEGGRVARLKSSLDAHELGPMLDYKDEGEETAYRNAQILSAALKKYGFNMDLAPIADVLTNDENTVIGDRAYSDDYEQAAVLVSAAIRGFQEENIITVIKHFPGHGSTSEDSHYGSAYVNKTLKELKKQDFLPFYAGIDSGADMVMPGHIITKDIDSKLPATLSYATITGVLRNKLGYDGLVITDALGMGALSQYGTKEIALGAVTAGVDILLAPDDLAGSVAAIKNAVEQGEVSRESIDESVYKILRLKADKGILTLP